MLFHLISAFCEFDITNFKFACILVLHHLPAHNKFICDKHKKLLATLLHQIILLIFILQIIVNVGTTKRGICKKSKKIVKDMLTFCQFRFCKQRIDFSVRIFLTNYFILFLPTTVTLRDNYFNFLFLSSSHRISAKLFHTPLKQTFIFESQIPW